ncbi:phosphoenolpyruvate--protein phosphotransferase [Gryllotalpicola protaetiae]|uniref:Phosphoenolpyruvate-protein phosphotransferase n=1 Tax=Gryllotalpicola protaetiae TaxID=2419771 RepID=A0A387BJG0_9MICO|nr:phosphoenolpyruvate--protein phosphotransferase [Gryllotalpicola protaetiae]AYG04235.1 phosphoenolpyruvate--protein phosphotransferase [Gryllotalpicola protaetiae]
MRINGIGVGRGIAVGAVLRMAEPIPDPLDSPRVADAATERSRLLAALAGTAAELAARAALVDGAARDVLEAQSLMAQDPSVIDDAARRIDAGQCAERAVFDAFGSYRTLLEGLGGAMAERAADLDDVCRRTVARLSGVKAPEIPASDRPFVLVAHDLAPADTAALDLDRVLAIVTAAGGPTSHTAILAKQRSLPAIVGAAGCRDLADGQLVVVDAPAGCVVADPSRAELAGARARRASADAPCASTPGALADGTHIPLLANLGDATDASSALALGAEGVGLLRTEFLYLDHQAAPSVAEQTARYADAFRPFTGRRVIVRVLDAGADKQLAFLGHEHEQNPALGRRGLRALREHEGVLGDQLRALVAARDLTGVELGVMAPMVADADETEYFVALARSLGVSSVGITAEVPSSAVLADQLAPLVDFISIGTNDLTQYTLAADRMLGSVAAFQDPWHPAVLRLARLVGQAGATAGIPVGVCGEAAGDPLLAVVLVGLGATELSMSPALLADVRAELAGHTLAQARELAALAVAARSAADARAEVSRRIARS